MADRAVRPGNMRPAFVWNPELRDSLPNLSGIADCLESAALQAVHGSLTPIKRDPLRNRKQALRPPKTPHFDDGPEIFTSEIFTTPGTFDDSDVDASDLFSDDFFSEPPPLITPPPLLTPPPQCAPAPIITTREVPITPVPTIPLVPIAPPIQARSIPKPPRPFDLELDPEVLVEISAQPADPFDPLDFELEPVPESAPASLRSSAPPVVRNMQPSHARLTRGVMAAMGAAAGAMLAFAFAPSKGSASVPLSRALTTPVVVFMFERAQKPEPSDAPNDAHEADDAPVLDLDLVKGQQHVAASAAVAGIAATTIANMPRKRPHVVIERAPYRSIPVRPAEPVAAYPIDSPKRIGWPKADDRPTPLEMPAPSEPSAPTPIETE